MAASAFRCTSSRDLLFGYTEDLDNVPPIDNVCGDIEALSALKMMGCSEGRPLRGRVCIEMVFNHNREGQVEEASNVRSFGKRRMQLCTQRRDL